MKTADPIGPYHEFEAEARERQRAAGGDKKSAEAKSVSQNSDQAIANPDLSKKGKVNAQIGLAVGVGAGSGIL